MKKKKCNLDEDCVHFNENQQCPYAIECRDKYIFRLETALVFSGKYDDLTVMEFRAFLDNLKGKTHEAQ